MTQLNEFLFGVAENVAAAGAGVVFTYAASQILKAIVRLRQEKQFGISGEYITCYDDQKGEATFSRSAPATLKQSGLKIEGETIFGETKWRLEGEITKDGYVHGRYFEVANSYGDKGFGNFFLKVKNSNLLEGIWSGYDHGEKKILTGKYVFTKTQEIELCPVQENHIPGILRIAQMQLGDSYIHPEMLIGDNVYAVVALADSKIVGFCFGNIVSAKEYLEKNPKIKDFKIRPLKAVDKIGVISSIAVDQDSVGHGIGGKLFDACVQKLIGAKAEALVMTGWKSDKGVHIGGIAHFNGFDNIGEILEYWKDDSLKNGYSCPTCGKPPCHCAAVFFVKYLL